MREVPLVGGFVVGPLGEHYFYEFVVGLEQSRDRVVLELCGGLPSMPEFDLGRAVFALRGVLDNFRGKVYSGTFRVETEILV